MSVGVLVRRRTSISHKPRAGSGAGTPCEAVSTRVCHKRPKGHLLSGCCACTPEDGAAPFSCLSVHGGGVSTLDGRHGDPRGSGSTCLLADGWRRRRRPGHRPGPDGNGRGQRRGRDHLGRRSSRAKGGTCPASTTRRHSLSRSAFALSYGLPRRLMEPTRPCWASIARWCLDAYCDLRTLSCSSSARGGGEHAVDLPGDITLEAARHLAFRQPIAQPPGDVRPRTRFGAHAAHDDHVQRRARLPGCRRGRAYGVAS